MMPSYNYSNTWFQQAARGVWERLLPALRPRKILEIGSFEGQSACFMIETLGADAPIELYCIDTFAGGVEHRAIDMSEVEKRFRSNVGVAIASAAHPVTLNVHRARSDTALPALLAGGHAGTFDFVYVDGSHQAADVLFDAVLAFRLTRVGGVICFDDYIWSEHQSGRQDLLSMPKPAIDAFVNLHMRKISLIDAPIRQVYLRKASD